ncbi:MAG: winged helix-turn-helix domain-containing protein [Candidatus Sulfotelmatobacter sp.]|jgi:DNA-binding winged helix-turn-helix (wHTH) protein/TolB-like protein/Flp pilus assembly protein TadD
MRRHIYEFRSFRVDAEDRQVWRDGLPISVSGKTFDVLLLLLRHSGHLVEKSVLLQEVWKDTCVEDGNVAVTISMLRKALDDDSRGNHYIQTVAKRGYRFIAPVRTISDEEAEPDSGAAGAGSTSPLKPSAESTLPSRLRRFQGLWAGASLVLLLAAFTSIFLVRIPGTRAREIHSVAVLPFRLVPADSRSSIGLAIADAVIIDLGANGDIDVRPTSAVQQYANSDTDPVAVGRAQKVDGVLTGTVERLADRLRVNVQFVSVADSSLLWTQRFEGAVSSQSPVDDEIAQQVAGALAKRLGLGSRMVQRRQQNLAAYQLYMQGRFFWNKRTEDGLRRSIEYFQQATLADPQYAAAYAGLADSYTLLSSYGVESAQQAYPNAKAAAYKALQLDPSLGEAYTSLGMVSFYYEWNWQQAERQFQRSIALNPNYPLAHTWYALELAAVGRCSDAMHQVQRAYDLDPLSLSVNTEVGRVFYWCRRYDRSAEALHKAIDLDPYFARAHTRLGMVYAAQGDFRAAIREFEQARQLSGPEPYLDALVAYAQASSGQRLLGRKALNDLIRRSHNQFVPAFSIALVCMGLGERDVALDWLAKAYQDRSTYMVYAKTDPLLDVLRTDRRFSDLLIRMGLNDQTSAPVDSQRAQTQGAPAAIKGDATISIAGGSPEAGHT